MLHFLLHSLNTLVAKCPKRIDIISTVLILIVLPLKISYAQEGVTSSNFLSKTSYPPAYLPGDTLTEYQQLPKFVNVTKTESQAGTTSTIRPWPSHNFFRSILSKSDNVANKTINRSNGVRRKSHETKTNFQKNASIPHQRTHRMGQQNITNSLKQNSDNIDKNTSANSSNYLANKTNVNTKDNILILTSTLKENLSEVTKSTKNYISSVLIGSKERLTTTRTNEVVSQRKFSSPSSPKESDEQPINNFKQFNNSNEKAENVTKSRVMENSRINNVSKENSRSYFYINSPQVGFQYEIVVTQPTPRPRPHPSISSSPRPSTTTPFKVTTQINKLNSLTTFPFLDGNTTATTYPLIPTHQWTTIRPTHFFSHKSTSLPLLHQQVQKKVSQAFPSQQHFKLNRTKLLNRQNTFTVAKGELKNQKIYMSTTNPTITSELLSRKPSNIKRTGLPAFLHPTTKIMGHSMGQSGYQSKITQSHWGSNGLNSKPQNSQLNLYSPSSSTLPFFDSGKVVGQSETTSFVTSKNTHPANIWYKPIINHFTAAVPAPCNGTHTLKTTMKPPTTTIHKIYMEMSHDHNDVFYVANKIREKTQKMTRNSSTLLEKRKPEEETSPILFKVWNLDKNGKLTLENQREIPPWALKGYSMPSSGTILNLEQIPPPLQPLVTSTLTMNKEDEHHVKQPISFNYVLWNNPSSSNNQDQAFILSSQPTPTLIPLSDPTPVTYFPSSSTITSLEDVPLSAVTINHSGSTTTNRYGTSNTTPRTRPNNLSQEKLESLFQNYFQYFITTSTTTTTTGPPLSVTLANKVTQAYSQQTDKSKPWQDLKALILRLAKNNKGIIPTNQASDTPNAEKTEDLDYLGNVAAIALIMSYIRNQYEQGTTTTITPPSITMPPHHPPTSFYQTSTPPTSTTPYGTTDDMVPPPKDQLWATVYPLFQHWLNNPNYKFIPPPGRQPSHSSNQMLLSQTPSYSMSVSMAPTFTSSGPIPFTEPITGTAPVTEASNYDNPYNHYATYSNTVATPQPTSLNSISHISITNNQMSKLRRRLRIKTTTTTEEPFRSDQFLDYNYDNYDDYIDTTTTTTEEPTTTQRAKTLLLLKKLKKKKKKKKIKKVAPALLGAGLVKKVGPLLGIMKKPKKYWLDMKFEIDFIDILKKKLLYMLAVKYMPVVMILALGVTPLLLSLVPLLYKMYWIKFFKKDKKYVKVKVPVKIPYPVPVYKEPPPYHHHDDHHGYNHYESYSPFHNQLQRPEIIYNENQHYASENANRVADDYLSQQFYRKSQSQEHEIRGDDHEIEKDLQPFPVADSYGYGFDIGQTLGGMTDKQSMDILKILVDTKKEKLNKLLEMWNLAKYGVAVASEAAMSAIRGPTTTPLYPGMQYGKKKKKRRKRRKKRRHSDNFFKRRHRNK